MRHTSKKFNQLNIWPGFVDILATLLIVTIFTILISGIAQMYFNDEIGKKKNQISELDIKISKIAEELSLKINNIKELKNQNLSLKSSMANKENLITNLKTSLKENELRLNLEKDKNFSLTKNNNELIDQVRIQNKNINSYKDEISKKEKKIINNQTNIFTLEKNIIELKKQILSLSKLLDQAEQEDKKNKVQIKNLGKKLNLALAGKVQELSEYQSIFLRKIKESIGQRRDIIISGDRFIFPSEILFSSASDEIEEKGMNELKTVAKKIKEISNIIPKEIDWIFRIDGHTDVRPIRNEKFYSNWHLSSSRAIKIVNFLISEGIPSNRLVAAGFGEFHPILNKNTEEAFKKNRRIEIKLTNR
tara:strand:+ start:1845 stop:2930 length:1086 start_codon:yes stop_codon:yes gene_type:complete